MRLTLRTLLAYMDDILEPADHEALSQKIETSDFATELIHRSRDTVRRLRLGAPDLFAGEDEDVLGDSDFSDANAVAEYLDNALPPEEVAEFERRCLESGQEADVHLAEVASCHHILTMVLGEPAEIDSALRKRVQQLPENLESGQHYRLEPAHTSTNQSTAEQTAYAPSSGEPDPARVPDYLRAAATSKRRLRRWIAVAALLASVVGYFGWGSWRPVEMPAEVAGLEAGSLELSVKGGSSPDASSSMADLSDETGSSTEAPAFSSAPSADPASEAPAFSVPEPTAEVAASIPEVTEPEVQADAKAIAATEPPADLDGEAPTSTDSVELSGVIDLPEPEMPSELASAGDPAGDSPELPDTVASAAAPEPGAAISAASEDPGESSTITEPPPIEEPVVEPPQGPVQLGSYLGNNDVLLIFNAEREEWIRLPPRSALSTGDRLLSLPKFRTHIVLANANLYLSGGTQVVLPTVEQWHGAEEGDLELEIAYGKVLLNAGLHGNQVALRIGDQVHRMNLGGSASLAVEVRRVFVPGGDFEHEASPIEVTWYLTSGSLEGLEAAGGVPIQAPTTWKTAYGTEEAPVSIDRLPNWIDREPVTDIQRRGRTVLADSLEPGQPVGIRLLELNDPNQQGRRSEVRMLAAESSVHVGEFEPFVKSLKDEDQSRVWESHIHTLRQALALSPEAAKRVREAFVSIRGESAADDLMQLVRGYDERAVGSTPAEIKEGAMMALLRWLDDDSLDYRVLAIHNLNEVTGTNYLFSYRPEHNSKQRKRALRKMWDRFESNELVPIASRAPE